MEPPEADVYVIPVRPSTARGQTYQQEHALTYRRIYTASVNNPQQVLRTIQVGEFVRISPRLALNGREDAYTDFIWTVVMKTNQVVYLQIVPIYAPTEIIPLLEEAYDQSESYAGVEYLATLTFLPNAIDFNPVDALPTEFMANDDMRTSVLFLSSTVDSIDQVDLEITLVTQQRGASAMPPTSARNIPAASIVGGGALTGFARSTTTDVSQQPSPAYRPFAAPVTPVPPATFAQPPQSQQRPSPTTTVPPPLVRAENLPPISTPILPTPTMIGAAPPEVEDLLASSTYQAVIQRFIQQRGMTPEAALLEARQRAFQEIQLGRQRAGLPPLQPLPRNPPRPPPPTLMPSLGAAASQNVGPTIVPMVVPLTLEQKQEQLYDQLNTIYTNLTPLTQAVAANYIAFELPESKRRMYVNAIELARSGFVDPIRSEIYLLDAQNKRIPFPVSLEQLAEIRRLWSREASRRGLVSTELPALTQTASTIMTAEGMRSALSPATGTRKASRKRKRATTKQPIPSSVPTTGADNMGVGDDIALAEALVGLGGAEKPSTRRVSTLEPPAAKRPRPARRPRTNVTARDIYRRDMKPQFMQIYRQRHMNEPFNIGQYNKELNEWVTERWQQVPANERAEYDRRAALESQQMKEAASRAKRAQVAMAAASAPPVASSSPAASQQVRSAAINRDITNIINQSVASPAADVAPRPSPLAAPMLSDDEIIIEEEQRISPMSIESGRSSTPNAIVVISDDDEDVDIRTLYRNP